jgi:hypothetical protein
MEAVKTSAAAWYSINVAAQRVVLFTSSYGDIIQLLEGCHTGLCHSWLSVPKGKDYQATSVSTMKILYVLLAVIWTAST